MPRKIWYEKFWQDRAWKIVEVRKIVFFYKYYQKTSIYVYYHFLKKIKIIEYLFCILEMVYGAEFLFCRPVVETWR